MPYCNCAPPHCKCAPAGVFAPACVCVRVNQSIRETEECSFLSCTSFPSLIRTHSVNQAWIPNTITCKVLCLGVIGPARAVLLKRLASLASLRPQRGALSKKCSWPGELKRARKGKGIKIIEGRFKTARMKQPPLWVLFRSIYISKYL